MRVKRLFVFAALLFVPGFSIVAQSQQQVLLDERFYHNSRSWPEYDADNSSCRVLNGSYQTEIKKEDGTWMGSIVLPMEEKQDFTIEAVLERIDGIDNYGYGLAWGVRDVNNFYYLNITANGYYEYGKCEDATYHDVIPWTASSAIQTATATTSNTNKLAVRCVNGELSFYINDTYVAQSTALPFYGDKVGFGVFRKMRVNFKSLLITQSVPQTEQQTASLGSGQDQTLLNEEFDDNSRQWDQNAGPEVVESVRNGRYILEETRPEGSRLSTIPLVIPQDKDFTVESTIDKVSGVDNYGFGLVWGLKDNNNFFHFLITGNGHYLYGKCVNGKYADDVDWTPSDAINDYNARNKLTVKKTGSQVRIFINDTYINTFPFESFSGNGIGFVNHHPKNLEIENLVVKTTAPQQVNLTSTGGGTVVLQDDFTTNNNEWFEAENEMVTLRRDYGKYVFEHKRTIGGYLTWMPTSLDAYADFTMTAAIKKVSGVDNYGYGLVWGVENNKNYYYFLIAANGNYIYGKTVDGVSKILTDWTPTNDVKPAGETNQLEVRKSGNSLSLIINGNIQKSVPFDGAFGNYVGFKIDNNVGIEISSILLTQDSKEATSPRKEIAKDITPPVITIVEPQVTRGMKPSVATKTILVRGTATDESGIFDVTVNDEEARIAEDGTFEAEVKLRVGENSIDVRASDLKNNVAEQHLTIVRESAPLGTMAETGSEASIQTSKFYALLIGVQDYQDKSVNSLDHPLADVQQLKDVLTTEYTFDPANITVLKDPDRKAVIHAFNDLKGKLTEQDNLLVFYAGHGYWDQDVKQGYWLPSDATASDPTDWISNGTIRDYVRGIKAKHTLLVADACFSGGIFKTREAFSKTDLSIQKTYEMTSRRAISSGALKAVPDRSVFVEYLVKRLKENRDKYLFAEKLYMNMKEAVINNSPNNQTPLYGVIGEAGDEGGDFIFVHR